MPMAVPAETLPARDEYTVVALVGDDRSAPEYIANPTAPDRYRALFINDLWYEHVGEDGTGIWLYQRAKAG